LTTKIEIFIKYGPFPHAIWIFTAQTISTRDIALSNGIHGGHVITPFIALIYTLWSNLHEEAGFCRVDLANSLNYAIVNGRIGTNSWHQRPSAMTEYPRYGKR
jgi:hypothetical protein